MDLIDECVLLGAAILSAQKLEFALYGIVSHLSHLPEAQKEKRFRDLTPEKFLHGNIEDLKVTLGQLETAFGEKLLISTNELKDFIKDRNIIAHSYWRLVKSNINDNDNLADPEAFLRGFITRCDQWVSIVSGLLYVFMKTAAEKEGRLSEIDFNEQQLNDITAYYAHASVSLVAQAGKPV